MSTPPLGPLHDPWAPRPTATDGPSPDAPPPGLGAPGLDPRAQAPVAPVPHAEASDRMGRLALACGVASFVCLPLGPLLGVAAIALGALGLASRPGRAAQRSSFVAVALGTAGLVVSVALLVALYAVRRDLSSLFSPTDAPEPRVAVAPVAPVPPRASPTRGARSPRGAPRPDVESTIGAITVVDVSKDSELAPTLARHARRAAQRGGRVVVQTTSAACEPCRGVAASLADPRVQTALAGVTLVRVDLYDHHEALDALAMPHDVFPGFFLLDGDGHAIDGVSGGEWGDDVPENIAPVLGAFVRGAYGTRSMPLPGYTAPRGTTL